MLKLRYGLFGLTGAATAGRAASCRHRQQRRESKFSHHEIAASSKSDCLQAL